MRHIILTIALLAGLIGVSPASAQSAHPNAHYGVTQKLYMIATFVPDMTVSELLKAACDLQTADRETCLFESRTIIAHMSQFGRFMRAARAAALDNDIAGEQALLRQAEAAADQWLTGYKQFARFLP